MGHTSTHIAAIFCSLTVVILLIPVVLSCSQNVPGLKHVYFLKIGDEDKFMNVGVSGYCDNESCHTPSIPFYLDVNEKQGSKELLHVGGKAIWVFYIISIASWGLCFIAGLLAHRIAYILVKATSVVGAVGLVIASGLGTGIYVHYRNQILDETNTAAALGNTALGLTWAAVVMGLFGMVHWLNLVARGHESKV